MPNERKELLGAAAAASERYLDSLDQRRVSPTPELLARLADFNEPMPNNPTDAAETFARLDTIGSPATMASAGGRYFGFVIGGALPVTIATNWLTAAWDQDAGLEAQSPAVAAIEDVAARWLVELLGFPSGTGVGFVTGATMANFTGLAAARHAVLQRAGWDVEANGLFGAPPISVIVGDEVHVSLLKALSLLGLGRDRIVRVPVDGQGRLRADVLPPIKSPAIVCMQAGNVNSGAFDPAEAICAAAHAAGAWVHVDAAFGLWAIAAPDRRHLTRGLADADSWATDAHKWLNVPYDSGIVFVREARHLRAGMSASAAAYLRRSEKRDPFAFTPELSRRARGVEVWAALRTLGRTGLADMIERNCRQAARFAEGLRKAGFEILNEVQLNQVLVSFGSDAATQRVIEAIQADGTCWCGGTVWHGRAAMRISVSSWATTSEDVERSLAAMIRIGREQGDRRMSA